MSGIEKMRSVILFIACSLDGYIVGKNDEIDWLFSDQDYGYTAFMETVDAIVRGHGVDRPDTGPPSLRLVVAGRFSEVVGDRKRDFPRCRCADEDL